MYNKVLIVLCWIYTYLIAQKIAVIRIKFWEDNKNVGISAL
jgi:hypothetical protein